MNNIRMNEIRVKVRSILTILIFGSPIAFPGFMFGLSPIPMHSATPESLKDDPNSIVENIIVRESRTSLSTVILTFADENAAAELQGYFHFLVYQGDGFHNYLAAGGLSLYNEPSLSDNQVLRFLLKAEFIAYSSIVYHNPADEPRYMRFRLSDWINREEKLDHDNDAQDQGSDGGGTVPSLEEGAAGSRSR